MGTVVYYKHVVTKHKVSFRTPGLENVKFVRMTKQQWLEAGRPDKIEL